MHKVAVCIQFHILQKKNSCCASTVCFVHLHVIESGRSIPGKCHTVPARVGSSTLCFVDFELCQPMVQILVATSALHVYQGSAADQRCILLDA